MTAITLRNIPAELKAAIERRAEQEGLSFNRTVLRMLEEFVGISASRQPVRHHDLDHLAGTWSRAEADELDAAINEQRTIDPDLWA